MPSSAGFNNLIYGNSNEGLFIRVAQPGSQVINNTIYQPVGDAIRVQGHSNGLRLENNILDVAAGYDLYVSPDSQNGFTSDYNLLFTSGSGQVGFFGGQSFSTRADWFYELGFDAHSVSDDPLFINPLVAHGQLGFQNGIDYGQDDNFHTLDSSPVVDAGDPNSSFSLEPSPNGGRVNIGYDGNTPQANASPRAIGAALGPRRTRGVRGRPAGRDQLALGRPVGHDRHRPAPAGQSHAGRLDCPRRERLG